MNIPSWSKALGIIMILFGGCSAVSSLQTISAPRLIDFQKEMFEGVFENIQYPDEHGRYPDIDSAHWEAEPADTVLVDSLSHAAADQHTEIISTDASKSDDAKDLEQITESFKSLWNISDFERTWMVRFGYLGLIVAFIYALGGVFLLVPKPYSIKLALGLWF